MKRHTFTYEFLRDFVSGFYIRGWKQNERIEPHLRL